MRTPAWREKPGLAATSSSTSLRLVKECLLGLVAAVTRERPAGGAVAALPDLGGLVAVRLPGRESKGQTGRALPG
jgi:hypothetical protein